MSETTTDMQRGSYISVVNEAANGGRLYNDAGSRLSLSSSAIHYNSQPNIRGGIFNQGTASLTDSFINDTSTPKWRWYH